MTVIIKPSSWISRSREKKEHRHHNHRLPRIWFVCKATTCFPCRRTAHLRYCTAIKWCTCEEPIKNSIHHVYTVILIRNESVGNVNELQSPTSFTIPHSQTGWARLSRDQNSTSSRRWKTSYFSFPSSFSFSVVRLPESE